MNESVKKLRIKPSKIVAVIAAVFLAAFIVAAVVLGVNIPRATRLYPMGGVGSMTDGADEWYVLTNDSKLLIMDAKGNAVDNYDIKALAEEEGISGENFGYANSVSKPYPASNDVYVSTSKGHLIQLRETDGELSVNGITNMGGSLTTMREKDGMLYVLNSRGGPVRISKYDVNNIEAGAIATGYLYTPAPKNDGTCSMLYVTNPKILSFEILEHKNGSTVEDFVYIVHGGGMLRFSADFRMNGWQDALSADVAQKIQEKIAAYPNYDSLTDVDKGKLYTQFRSEAAEEVVVNYESQGVKAYNPATGEISVDYNAFSKSGAYLHNPPDGGKVFRGAGYDVQKQCFYLLTHEKCIYTYALNELPLRNAQPLLLDTKLGGITLPATPMSEGHAMFYNSTLNVGYIVYNASNRMTRVDFNTGKATFTTKTNDAIRLVVQNANGKDCYYIYYNKNEAATGQFILRHFNIENQENYLVLEGFMTASIVAAVIAALCLTLALLCIFKPGFSEKFQDTMRLVKKHWVIYVVIAACFSLVAMFCYYPAIGSIALSFFDYTTKNESKVWNNFANYAEVFTSQRAALEFGNMFLFLATDLFTALVPPLIFAFFLTIMRNKQYSAVMRTLLFIPGVIPGIAGMLIWKSGIYDYPNGVINMVIQLFKGKPFNFMHHDIGTRISIIMMGFPFVGSYLIFYGAMMNVPDSYYEAAELDGITVIKRFVFIDVPLIFAQIKYVLIMTFISSGQNFGRTYMMDPNNSYQTNTPIHTMYLHTIDGNYGMASAYATVIFVFLFAATVFNMYSQRRDQEDM